MTVKVTIRPKVTLNRKTQLALENLASKMKHPESANLQVSTYLMRWVNENFRTEGKLVGGWEPFKQGGRRLKGGFIDKTAKLLDDTGQLRASYLPFYNRVNAGVGSELPYAEYHQRGTSRGLPSRSMIPKQNDPLVTEKILKIYEVYVLRSGQSLGFRTGGRSKGFTI